ncbi:MAG: serine/threonine-protein phosphatase [Chloroflexi bacterium]|nr:serine/threonine-protein phosphatase [Chloroflexota bacterium]MBU1750695.1 serine/threonine-protein phosphatase [Chloroflexota bacterium]
MEIQIAAAKTPKYAVRESGDTLEMIERPGGGISLVLADGQGSGAGAKALSHLVARKAVSLLADGVRDGAAARATHDFLYNHRQGRVSATLNIISVDLTTHTIVISRNSHCPVIVADPAALHVYDEPCQPVGIYPRTKPIITEVPISPGITVIVFTDGVLHAGSRHSNPLDAPAVLEPLLQQQPPASAESLAEGLLTAALACDQGRPSDDISVVVVAVRPRDQNQDHVRHLNLRLPID